MKKSLSAILSMAMAFSMFSSVAFGAEAGKTSADFTDLKDLDAATKAKFDALISAGVFDGVKEGEFGLNDKMNRAQFAKVAALIFNLKVDSSLKTSSFTDVKADDPANGYALPYIEAVKAAGITDGYGPGVFNPAGEVTKEQLAAFLVRGLGWETEAKATPGVSDKTVSDWAKSYVALAISKKILTSGTDGTFGGTSAALRKELVLGASEAKANYKAPTVAKAEITKVEAVGAKALKVTFNGAIDGTKATLSVKRDGSAVTGTTKFAADNASATITLDAKLIDAKYVVELAGVELGEKKTGEVVAVKEKISKVEFLTTSDTLPLTNKVKVKFKASNQYGEQSDLSAANFTIATGDVAYNTVSNEQTITLDLAAKKKDDKVPVTIIHSDSGSQVSKVFTVGEAPYVAKVEAGDLFDSNNNKVESIEAGKSAYLGYTAFDQYGIAIEDKAVLNSSGKGVTIVTSDSNVFKGDLTDKNNGFIDSVIGTDAPELKLTADAKATEKEITVTLFANGSGQSVNKVVKVTTPKIPATVEFGSFTSGVAKGDKNVYLPIVVKDAAGYQLSAQEIADNADKFTIYATGGVFTLATAIDGSVTNYIQQTGADKGKIRIGTVDNKGNGTVVVQLKDKPSVQQSFNVGVTDDRKPDRIDITDQANAKLLPGATNETKWKAFDQFNGDAKDKRDDWKTVDNYRVKWELTAVSGTTTALANVTSEGNADTTYTTVGNVVGGKLVLVPSSTVGATVYGYTTLEQMFDKKMTFTAASAGEGIFKLAGVIEKKDSVTGLWAEVSRKEKQVEVYSGQNATLTYGVALDKAVDNTLFAVGKYADNGGTVGGATYSATQVATSWTKLGKEVKVTATDKDGNKVALNAPIVSITSSNNAVLSVGTSGNFVAGNKAGTAVITVVFNTPKGMSSAQLTATVKEDIPTVTTIKSDKSGNAVSASVLNGKFAWDEKLMNKLTVNDSYGTEYINEKDPSALKDQNVTKYNDVLGIRYFISNVKYKDGVAVAAQDKISINPTTGAITYTNSADAAVVAANRNVTSFTINAIAPSGKSTSVDVNVDAN